MDTSGQLAMYLSFSQQNDLATLSTHHPLFDTFVFGFIIDSVYKLTGDIHLGIFVLTSLQLLCTAAAFSVFFVFAYKKWSCSTVLLAILILFVALFPLFPIMVCSVSKDSFFSWIYILFFTSLIDIILSVYRGLEIPCSSIALLSGAGLLMGLTKNLGAFIALFSVLSLFALRFQNRWVMIKTIIPALICVVMAGSLTYVVPRAIGITGGGAQEMLSIPFQQSALMLINHKDEIPEEELDILAKVLNVDSINTDYKPRNADGIKGFDPRGSSLDYRAYLRTWFIEGFFYPKEYFEAFALMESPIFSDRVIQLIYNSNWTSASPVLPKGYNAKNSFNEKASDSIKQFYVWFSSVPIFKPFCTEFFYVIFVPIILLISLCRNRLFRQYLPAIAMILVSLAGLFVSPITGDHFEATRYVMPFIYTTPIVFVTCVLINQKKFGTRKED